MTSRIGIDLGGTKIEGVVLDSVGVEIFRRRERTEQEKGYDAILSKIAGLYRLLAEKTPGPHTLGIGTPGALSLRSGLLKNSNTLCLNGKPLKRDLVKILGRDLQIQNDANCFAMAEALLGEGKGKKLVFGVIMGTGCGGGIVYNGEVLSGLQHIGGEWGHMSIDPAGPECYCGRRGCVETLISGGGLETRYFEKYGKRKSLKEIVSLFRSQDSKAALFMAEFFRNFGRALANVINILDPDIVVLGGGVSNIEELYTLGAAEVRRQIFSDSLETPIVRNRLGDSAGVLGAAMAGV